MAVELRVISLECSKKTNLNVAVALRVHFPVGAISFECIRLCTYEKISLSHITTFRLSPK